MISEVEFDKNEILQFEELIDGLIQNDYGICNHFLPDNIMEGLIANMSIFEKQGKLKNAGIGTFHHFQKDKSIRRDKINWINENSQNNDEIFYLKKITRFINYLNISCFTSIKSFESHYAKYDKGDFYKRHLDQFKNENSRKYSVVLYLNKNWKMEDEGYLTLYPKKVETVNILPTYGKFVFFKSDEMEHEVKPSNTKTRKSITGWLKI